MWYKIKAGVAKELVLLLRDKVGLIILFLMPVALIFLMTMIQNAVFTSVNEQGISIAFVDDDQKELGKAVEEGLKDSPMCELITEAQGKLLTRSEIEKAVAQGEFLMGIYIPKGSTDYIRNQVDVMITTAMNEPGKPVNTKNPEIVLYIDPVAKNSIVTSISASLREYISQTKSKLMFDVFVTEIKSYIPESETESESKTLPTIESIHFKEVYASELIDNKPPNAVQHNVPAWTIFGMFFIVVPLVSSIMKEKTEGSLFRLHTLPVPYYVHLISKVLVFSMICLLQFALMLAVGVFVMPLTGLPALTLGNSYSGIMVMALATAFGATGFGVLVGTLARTQQQGAVFGALSILLLSALGGIWVPTYVMPEVMRTICQLSPLNWSLEGFYHLLIRGGTIDSVVPHTLGLIFFGLICLLSAVYIQQRTGKNGRTKN